MTLPTPLKQLWNGWKAFSHALGVVMSSIILTILWIVVFGLYAIVLKIGAVFAKRPDLQTYWKDGTKEHSDFAHQF